MKNLLLRIHFKYSVTGSFLVGFYFRDAPVRDSPVVSASGYVTCMTHSVRFQWAAASARLSPAPCCYCCCWRWLAARSHRLAHQPAPSSPARSTAGGRRNICRQPTLFVWRGGTVRERWPPHSGKLAAPCCGDTLRSNIRR